MKPTNPAPDGTASPASDHAVSSATFDQPGAAATQATHRNLILIRNFLGIIVVICAAALIFFAKEVILPFVLGVLIALTLSPLTRGLARHGVPPLISAGLLVLAVAATVAGGIYLLSGPVAEWIDEAPRMRAVLEQRLRAITSSLETVREASQRVEDIAASTEDSDVIKVAIDQPGIIASTALDIVTLATTAMVALVLALFLLASNDMFYLKIVQSFPSLTEKTRALQIVYSIERRISRYLLSVTLINAGLGVVVGCCMWIIGMPQPVVWGAIAFLFNFLPYIGSLAGVVLCAVVSLVTFSALSYAVLAPLAYLLATLIEGQFVTPVLLGRRLNLNAVAVFAAVVLWAWVWGVAGALMAVPLLVCLKSLCDHVPALSVLGTFLGDSSAPAARPAA
ncbi:AI-2E family transporter [Epibacterium sp. Ofav1-8]|uniref:AI-2E family transporter n=1 Tax=Epibacterium sp. Ofav1-8 TaxID=2917735 RepID=UPI001EF52E6F|nr:AI-2E family transporter [Epibacterium sp. Ofav1-8]MCG7623373.1 AI-2E family transporter [Epibacterium sp. Ofav1-8]